MPAWRTCGSGIRTSRAFAEQYRVIRYDSRGYGQSESEHVEFSNHGDLEQALDHLGVPATHLLGTSRSASIALNFAVTHPQRVTSLIEVAGGGVGEPELSAEEAAAGRRHGQGQRGGARGEGLEAIGRSRDRVLG